MTVPDPFAVEGANDAVCVPSDYRITMAIKSVRNGTASRSMRPHADNRLAETRSVADLPVHPFMVHSVRCDENYQLASPLDCWPEYPLLDVVIATSIIRSIARYGRGPDLDTLTLEQSLEILDFRVVLVPVRHKDIMCF